MQKNGFTLFETLLVLSVMIILSVMTITSFQSIDQYTQAKISLTEITNLLMRAKQEAALRRIPIALCKATAMKCHETGKDLLLFLNEKEDGRLHGRKNILAKYSLSKDKHLRWRIYPIYRNYLLFFPNSITSNDNGTIWYCDKDKATWALVMSKTGIYTVLWPNEEGILLDNKGKRLECLV